MEGGGLEYSDASQELYEGEVVGRAYHDLTVPRLRFFGGTSNHWAGWCIPLAEHDFEAKPYQEWSGWPIGKADLDPYYDETLDILDIAKADTQPSAPLSFHHDTLQVFNVLFSPPTRFAEKFGAELRTSANIHLVLNANLTDIVLAENRRQVVRCEFRNYVDDEPIIILAKTYVLCLGGLENPRILLAINKGTASGIGNRQDLVGRFFSDHPHFSVGRYLLNSDNPEVPAVLRDQGVKKPRNVVAIAPTKSFMLQKEIPGFSLRLFPYADIKRNRDGIKAFLQRQLCSTDFSTQLVEAVNGQIPNWWDCFYGNIAIATEQGVNYDSRVSLSSAKDRFGLPRIKLDWRFGEPDRRTIRIGALELGRQFAVNDWGRIQIIDWILDDDLPIPGPDEEQYTGMHHIGTTRMASEPTRGVVDSNLKVFNHDNLFVCGSSVFSTSSHANPTFTIVQLALRLGAHLSKVVDRH